jgi:hypothetical protein
MCRIENVENPHEQANVPGVSGRDGVTGTDGTEGALVLDYTADARASGGCASHPDGPAPSCRYCGDVA